MHGYQIMRELGERSGGVWRPSPGSIYPTLQQLEDEELVRPETGDGGRRVFTLTDAGREAQSAAAGGPAPWDEVGAEGDASALELRDLVGQVMGAARQVLHAGEPAQIAQAKDVLRDARRKLYRILAEDSPEPRGRRATERSARPRDRGRPARAGLTPDCGPVPDVAVRRTLSAVQTVGRRLPANASGRPDACVRAAERVSRGVAAVRRSGQVRNAGVRPARRGPDPVVARYRPRMLDRPPPLGCWPSRGEAEPDVVIEGAQVFGAFTREWLEGDVAIADGRFAGIGSYEGGSASTGGGRWLCAGFIDAHMHVESSKLTVGELARAARRARHDDDRVRPARARERARARGRALVPRRLRGPAARRARARARRACRRAPFESPRAPLSLADLAGILARERVLGLAEMMNFPAVIAGAPAELAKIALAPGKRVDGHAPGVSGPQLDAYLATGHRHRSRGDDARARRSRSAARAPGCCCARPRTRATCATCCRSCASYGPERCAFCTDDREPDMLLREGHIDQMCRVAVAEGIAPEDALLLATLHPALCHGLPRVGAIAPGYRADCVLLDDLGSFRAVARAQGRARRRRGRRRRAVRRPRPRRTGCATACASRRCRRTPSGSPHARRARARDRARARSDPDRAPRRSRRASATARSWPTPSATSPRSPSSSATTRAAASASGSCAASACGAARWRRPSRTTRTTSSPSGMDDDDLARCVERLAEIGGGIAIYERRRAARRAGAADRRAHVRAAGRAPSSSSSTTCTPSCASSARRSRRRS